MSQAFSIAANVVPMAALAGSLAVLFWLFQRHVDGRPLLRYEPRRPVPWNGVAPALILAIVFTPMAVGLFAGGVDLSNEPPAELAPADAAAIAASASASAATAGPAAGGAITVAESATTGSWSISPPDPVPQWLIWGQAATFLLFALTIHAALAGLFGATPTDLGWPTSWGEAGRDVAIGFITFLAVLAPVYALQLTLIYVFEPESGHPLIEQLQTQHSPSMLAAAFVVAAIGAPLFEESAFRLILQGWLERVETNARGGRLPSPEELVEPAVAETDVVLAERAAVAGGWAPVLISGTLFALAHTGQGVAPASLLPLGLALGYVYQRTHRILPSIICHALFNAFSLVMLWLYLAAGTPTAAP